MKKSFGSITALYPLPVLLIGTYDSECKANLMTASWGGIVNSDPPYVSVSVRKERHTYTSLNFNQEFSICIPSADRVFDADYCGIHSNKHNDKIAELGLTASKSEIINAPIIAEFPIAILCRVKFTQDLGSHTIFISEIVDFQVEEYALTNGKADIEKISPLLYDTISKYYYKIGEKVFKAYTAKK